MVSIFKSITNFLSTKNIDEIDYILDKAHYLATHNRQAKVVLDIPFNLKGNSNQKKPKKI